MKIEQTVVCPHPECDWQATFAVDIETDSTFRHGTWREGVVRGALDQLRRLHVMDEHIEVSKRKVTP